MMMPSLGQAALTIDGAKFASQPVARLSYNIFLEDSGDLSRCTAHIWLELHLNLKPGTPLHLSNDSIVFSSIFPRTVRGLDESLPDAVNEDVEPMSIGTTVDVLDAIDLFVVQGNPNQGNGNRERSTSRLYERKNIGVVPPPNLGPLKSRYATLRKETHNLRLSAADSVTGDGEHIDPAYIEVSGSNVPAFNAYPARWASDKKSFEFIKRAEAGKSATHFDGTDLKKPIGDARLVVWVCWKENFGLSPSKDFFARRFELLADRLVPKYLNSSEVYPAPMELEIVVTIPPGCRDDTEYLKYSSEGIVAEWKESKEGTNEGIFWEWSEGYSGGSRRFVTMNIQTVGDFGNLQGKRIKVLYYDRKADLKRQADLTLSSIVFAITLGSPLAVNSNISNILSNIWPWSILLVFPFLFLSLLDRHVRSKLLDRASKPKRIPKWMEYWWIRSGAVLGIAIFVAMIAMWPSVAMIAMWPFNDPNDIWPEIRQALAIMGMVSAYWLQVRLGFDTIEKLAHTGPLTETATEHSRVRQRWGSAPNVRLTFAYHAVLVFAFIFLALKGAPTASGSRTISEIISPSNAASAPMQR